ncbi:MAG: TolC family outer membrane protein [Pseudomonadota bacterium]
MHPLSSPTVLRRQGLSSWLCAAAFSVMACGAASAQNLLSLYDAARAFDATYLSAQALANSATFRAEQANALGRPSAALNASGARTHTEVLDFTRSATTSGVSLQARQPLFNRENSATIDQAGKFLEVSRFDLEAAEQDLILRVAQGYFDVLAAQDTLATTRASKAAINEQLASAKRNFEVGTATITDTREAQARFDLVTAQEIAADNDLRTKRIALDQLVGQVNVEPRPLRTPVRLPELEPGQADAWVMQADANHPTIRRAQLALDIAQLEIRKARAGHLPTLDAVGSVSRNRSPSSVLSTTNITSESASLGLQLNVPLYSGNAVQNRVKETLALEDRARNDLEAARRGVVQAARQAFFGVQSGQAQVAALEAAESSSQLALEATQLGYKVGVRVNLDVLNAQTQLFTTRRDLARARYDVLIGSLRLRQAAGQLQPRDVSMLNQLLAP